MRIGRSVSFLVVVVTGLALTFALGVYAFDPFAKHVAKGPQFSELDSDKPDAITVLFIGNSFTFYGPLPEIFGKLVQAGQPARGLKVRMVAFPNAKLVELEQDGRAARAIAHDGPWEYVVMQDQSRMAWSDPVAMRIGAERLDAHVRAAGARTVLYMTWAEAKETAREQEVITGAYDRLGTDLRVPVAPVGRAWFEAEALRQKFYGPDGHHPSPLGVYMTACVLYAVLVGKSPQGLPYPSTEGPRPTEEDIRAVQRAAARTTGMSVE